MGSGRPYQAKVNKLPLPTQAPDDYTSGAFCIKLSPQWFWIVQGITELLTLRALWEWTNEAEWLLIRQWLDRLATLRECEPCEECPPAPPEPPAPPAQPLPIGSMTGLTLDELEGFFLMWTLRGQLAWVNGKLCFASTGCDDWCEVPTISGVAPTGLSPEAIKALSQGKLSLQQWEEAGQPDISAGDTPVASELNLYTTSDAMACVKASAFIDAMRELLDEIGNGLQLSALSITGILTGIGAYLSTAGIPAAGIFDIATIIFGAFVGISAQQAQDDIEESLDDPDWNNLYCQLVPMMQPTVSFGGLLLNRATVADYAALVGLIKANITITPEVGQILDTFPVDGFLPLVRNRLPTQECLCEQYLPLGYVPPASAGAINFMELIYSGHENSAGWAFDYANALPYAGMMLSPDQGQIVSASSWRTTYTGADNDSGEPNKYTQVSLLLDMPDNTQIDQLKFDVAVNGVVQGAGIVKLDVNTSVFNQSDVWQTVNVSSYTLESATDLVFDPTNIIGSKLAINFMTRNENINLYAVISNLRFTGNRSGAGFLDVPLGQQLP